MLILLDTEYKVNEINIMEVVMIYNYRFLFLIIGLMFLVVGYLLRVWARISVFGGDTRSLMTSIVLKDAACVVGSILKICGAILVFICMIACRYGG